MITILTAVSQESEAKRIARGIVEARLAGCVQILPAMTSVYFWEGRLREESERLLLIKTTEEKYSEVESFIQENHSYDIPEIVTISAEQVSEKYLAWLSSYVSGAEEE